MGYDDDDDEEEEEEEQDGLVVMMAMVVVVVVMMMMMMMMMVAVLGEEGVKGNITRINNNMKEVRFTPSLHIRRFISRCSLFHQNNNLCEQKSAFLNQSRCLYIH